MKHLVLIIQYILKPLKVDIVNCKDKIQHYFNKFEHLSFQCKLETLLWAYGMPKVK